MRVNRSLHPGKVFFEKNGVLQLVDAATLKGKAGDRKTSGWNVTGGVLMQWGVSSSVLVIDDIIFPVPFLYTPEIRLEVQGAVATAHNVSTTGFQIRTHAESVLWSAFGPAPRR